jgi:hypothetical protein
MTIILLILALEMGIISLKFGNEHMSFWYWENDPLSIIKKGQTIFFSNHIYPSTTEVMNPFKGTCIE